MKDIDMVILSHGHFDHGDGLWNLSGGRLLCHPGCFVKRYKKWTSYIGFKNSKDELAGRFELVTASKPYNIYEQIFFLDFSVTDFESLTTSFVFEDGTHDFVMDDSAMAIIMAEGLFCCDWLWACWNC